MVSAMTSSPIMSTSSSSRLASTLIVSRTVPAPPAPALGFLSRAALGPAAGSGLAGTPAAATLASASARGGASAGAAWSGASGDSDSGAAADAAGSGAAGRPSPRMTAAKPPISSGSLAGGTSGELEANASPMLATMPLIASLASKVNSIGRPSILNSPARTMSSMVSASWATT